MPARQRARRVTVREVLDTAIELEKKTMSLYVTFVKAFPRPEEVRNFWFGMARHEAGHCGALSLVRSPRWRERAIQLLIHDLADLSYMVERYTKNDRLLARADALIERHVGGLARRRRRTARAVRA